MVLSETFWVNLLKDYLLFRSCVYKQIRSSKFDEKVIKYYGEQFLIPLRGILSVDRVKDDVHMIKKFLDMSLHDLQGMHAKCTSIDAPEKVKTAVFLVLGCVTLTLDKTKELFIRMNSGLEEDHTEDPVIVSPI